METVLTMLAALLSKNGSQAINKLSGFTNSAKQTNNLWQKFQPME